VRVWPGSPFPLGATFDGAGVNFALFSEHATAVDLCLYGHPDARTEQRRIRLADRTEGVWHAYLPGVHPGQLYGYRVHGTWDPGLGFRFNPAKVLLDPYARALGRELKWDPSLFAYERGTDGDGPPDPVDSAPYAPLGMVVGHDEFDWGNDRLLRTPWTDTVIYEAHVKGATAVLPSVPQEIRGTYLGLAHPAFVDHLQRLGVTALELLPVQGHSDEWELAETARTNYWGYNTLAYFVPDSRFATSAADAVRDFRTMVRALHASGIEVLLDVVYNHTAEGGHRGPSLSWRGIDNRSYYRLDAARPSHYENLSGTGNTLDIRHPRALQLVMDSLRYWVEHMHVDGFRFDLATVLARDSPDFTPRAAFLQAIDQDPVLSRVKLIAEPWDVATFRVGQFPATWSEWNGHYRDDVRRFWRGDRGMLSRLAYRLSGSSDVFGSGLRGPRASINFITSHDGFTLADLVAYERKHNEANGEDNRDGENNNYSWNGGVEGPTDDPAILAERARDRRNLLVTLLVSLGVPMISGGDELGRTQRGNNNAYAHDSPLSWTPWSDDEIDGEFLSFARALGAFRHAHPVFGRHAFLNGAGHRAADVRWLRPEGGELTASEWTDASRQCLGMLLDGRAIDQRTPTGELIVGATLLVLLNAGTDVVDFELPNIEGSGTWIVAVDTAGPDHTPRAVGDERAIQLPAQTAMVLESTY
jgi:isoamylase